MEKKGGGGSCWKAMVDTPYSAVCWEKKGAKVHRANRNCERCVSKIAFQRRGINAVSQ